MGREHILLIVALPIIGVAGWLLWKEYGEFYGRPPVELPEISQPAQQTISRYAPTSAPTVSSDRGRAVEQSPEKRSSEEAAVIARAKRTLVSSLDSSLPRQATADWMGSTAGESARISWEVNDCGDVDKQPGALPVCAQANIDLSSGTKFQALLLMGTRTSKSRGIQFSDPSLMWAAYSKSDGDQLTPAPLSALSRIALAD